MGHGPCHQEAKGARCAPPCGAGFLLQDKHLVCLPREFHKANMVYPHGSRGLAQDEIDIGLLVGVEVLGGVDLEGEARPGACAVHLHRGSGEVHAGAIAVVEADVEAAPLAFQLLHLVHAHEEADFVIGVGLDVLEILHETGIDRIAAVQLDGGAFRQED